MNIRFLFLLFTLLFSNGLHADVLFIDLNNAHEEVETARVEAKKRGEKLIVLPANHKYYAKNNAAYAIAFNNYTQAKDLLSACKKKGPAANCDDIEKKKNEAQDVYNNAPKDLYGEQELVKDLETLSNISSIMISGHDGGGDFKGGMGTVSADSFLKIFSQSPFRDQVKSLYLLGCESAKSHVMGSTWKAAFPKALFIAGYENIGFLGSNPGSKEFIRELMSSERQIRTASTMREALDLFKKINPEKRKYRAAACFQIPNDEPMFISTEETKPLTKVLGCEPAVMARVLDLVQCATEGKKKSCPLPQGEDQKALQEFRKCSYLLSDRNFNQIQKLRNQAEALGYLNGRDSKISFATMFLEADPEIQQRLKLNEPITDYVDGKQKMLEIKNSYDLMVKSDKLDSLPPAAMLQFYKSKTFFEERWLTTSNLSLSKPPDVETKEKLNAMPTLAGELRAAQYMERVAQSRQKQTIVLQRINQLGIDLENEKTPAGKTLLQAERAYLQKRAK